MKPTDSAPPRAAPAAEPPLPPAADQHRREAASLGEAQQRGTSSMSLEALELKRKKNRDCMIRARKRKKNSNEQMKVQLVTLSKRLRKLTHGVIEDARTNTDGGLIGHCKQLEAETASLVNANNELREQIRQRKDFQKALVFAVEQKNGPEAQTIDQDNSISSAYSPPAELQGLLRWLRGNLIDKLREKSSQMLLQHVERVDAIVTKPDIALGWANKRLVETTWLSYLFRKDFPGRDAEATMEKTWKSTVSLDRFSKVIRWAKDMKILHWLSPDAAIIKREIDVPNSACGEMPTRICFTLLVSRIVTPDGFTIVTQNLNTSATSIQECFDRDLCSPPGMNTPYTMYGLVFRRIPRKSGSAEGCSVTLAGVAGNRTNAYVHLLSMEMIPVVLLWENAIIGSIVKLTSD